MSERPRTPTPRCPEWIDDPHRVAVTLHATSPCFAAVLSIGIALCGSIAQADTWRPGQPEFALWPEAAPGARATTDETVETVDCKIGGKSCTGIRNVSRPTLTVYAPKGTNTGAAIVVFPGGGYKALAIDLEGTEVCDWLTAKGITCIVLKYRVPNSGPYWDEKCKCHVTPPVPLALQDAQRALGLVRAHAGEWHVDPHKIGVLGFSAGGHLVAAVSTHFQSRAYTPIDAADQQSARPDFALMLYPGHLWTNQDKLDPGLLWTDQDKLALNPDISVTAQTPPTFLVQAENDNVDSINHSLVYYIALKDAGVPVEMHLYAEGGHAFGLRRAVQPITGWPYLAETWLRTLGMIAN